MSWRSKVLIHLLRLKSTLPAAIVLSVEDAHGKVPAASVWTSVAPCDIPRRRSGKRGVVDVLNETILHALCRKSVAAPSASVSLLVGRVFMNLLD